MSEELLKKLRELRNVEKEMEWLKKDMNDKKAEIERLIINEKMVGKTFHLKDRYVVYKKIKTPQGLSQDYLKGCLKEYYHNHPREADALFQYIKDNRAIKTNYGLQVTKKKMTK